MNQNFSSGQFSRAVLKWYAQHGRKTLPWQQNKTPYRVWLSEIMLQQTQVSTVIPYFEKFIARFPTIHPLAEAPVDDVLALWSGLGYYTRARHLHACAQTIVREHAGEFPNTVDEVSALQGIGRSTAGAILSLSRNANAAICDGNVKRVLCRVTGTRLYENRRHNETALWQLAEKLVPDNAADYNQAMMDIGAIVCTRSKPDCAACPLQTFCVAKQENNFDDYPGRKPKKTIPEKSSRFLLLRDGDRVLLQQRAPTGIWGGLWIPPEIPPHLSPAEMASEWGASVEKLKAMPVFRHTFSHFHLNIHGFSGVLSPSTTRMMRVRDAVTRWQSLSALDAVGLPAPMRRLLDQLEVKP